MILVTDEIVITDDQVRRFTGYIRSSLTHRHTDIGRSQGRRVVDSVTCDCDEMARLTSGLDNLQLLTRCDASKHTNSIHHLAQLCHRLTFQIGRSDNLLITIGKTKITSDRQRRNSVIARHH